jgi:signal transduction histidine kinase
LCQEEDSLKLVIHDDGLGFNPALAFEQALGGQSMGLLGMRERVTLIGGTLTIDSSAGRGTTLEARFPLTLMRSVERRASRRGAK